jgi:hypothetical protein
MRLWHATRALDAVMADGWVRPMRMAYVYAFTTREAAQKYAADFGYDAVVEVESGSAAVRGRWSPAYAGGADVVCLRDPVRVVRRCHDYEVLGDAELPPDLEARVEEATAQADRDVPVVVGQVRALRSPEAPPVDVVVAAVADGVATCFEVRKLGPEWRLWCVNHAVRHVGRESLGEVVGQWGGPVPAEDDAWQVHLDAVLA